jgi:hypothetical protein
LVPHDPERAGCEIATDDAAGPVRVHEPHGDSEEVAEPLRQPDAARHASDHAVTVPASDSPSAQPSQARHSMFLFFANRLGCLGSLLA